MFRRLGLFGLVMAILAMLAAQTGVSAGGRAYSEGIHFEMTVRQVGTAMSVTATKNVDGRWRQAEVRFGYFLGYESVFFETAVLGEDPDGLDVSRDLGWGGLEGQITVFSRLDRRYHLVEFHIWQFASEPGYTENPETGCFERSALVEGYVLVDGQLLMDFRGPAPANVHVVAYNFSDQWPGY